MWKYKSSAGLVREHYKGNDVSAGSGVRVDSAASREVRCTNFLCEKKKTRTPRLLKKILCGQTGKQKKKAAAQTFYKAITWKDIIDYETIKNSFSAGEGIECVCHHLFSVSNRYI